MKFKISFINKAAVIYFPIVIKYLINTWIFHIIFFYVLIHIIFLMNIIIVYK